MNATLAPAETDLLEAALDNAGRGFHVFPLHPGTKVPVITHWEDNATRDVDRIRRWWRRWPTDNVAAACQPSGLHVLDLDTRGGHPCSRPPSLDLDGRDVLVQLAAQTGQPLPIPTYTVQTPSQGLHLYYRAPRTPLLRNTIGRLGRHIDSRGSGGYVVAAGSKLPYGSYRLLDDRTPIPLPGWLTGLLAPPPAPHPPRIGIAVHHRDAYVEAAVSNQCARIRHARTGTRHREVLLAANSLGRLVGAGLLDYLHAETALLDAAGVHVGIDDFTAEEARRTITDGLIYAAQRTHPPPGGHNETENCDAADDRR
ncbi:bifunctional DNA primase/polymerase [Nocardia sp. CA-128927]|uniref:bifunctional DNA primase/polymerase n=1 Tax=Nocardia sp. CA-128927 TaxID=3239975 RepID=UPI003D99EC43